MSRPTAKLLEFTSDQQQLFFVTGDNDAGVSVVVDGNLGSGTLTLRVAPQADPDATPIDLDATLADGTNQYYRLGRGVAVYVDLNGATAPSVKVLVCPVAGNLD